MFRKKKASVVIGLAAAFAVGLSACASDDGSTEFEGAGFDECEDEPTECNSGPRRDGGDVTWALDAAWGGWSEVHVDGRSTYQMQVMKPMYPLVGEFDQRGDFEFNDGIFAEDPELVHEFPVEVAYNIRDDATWGDGTPITIEDFLYNWYAWSGDPEKCNEKCAPASGAWGPHVEDIYDGGDGRIVVTYEEGFQDPEWQHAPVLSHPAHVAEREGFDWKNNPNDMGESMEYFLTNPPTWSAGPYIIDDVEDREHVTYVPNPEWAGESEPTLDSVTIEVIEDVEAMMTELRQGTIHGATPARYEPEIVDQLMEEDNIRYDIAPGPSWEMLMLNLQQPHLEDLELRRAIFTAFDVDDVNSRTHGLVTEDVPQKLNYLFEEGTEHFVDHIGPLGFGEGNAEAAQKILQDAGYEWDSDDNLLDEHGQPIQIEHRLMSGPSVLEVQAEMLQSYMSTIGIDVTINTFSNEELNSILMSGEWDSINVGWSTPPSFATEPAQLWASGSGQNFGGLTDDAIDESINLVQSSNDVTTASVFANDAMELVAEQAYQLPLNDGPTLIMVSDELVNVRDNWASTQRGLYNVAEWGLVDPDAVD